MRNIKTQIVDEYNSRGKDQISEKDVTITWHDDSDVDFTLYGCFQWWCKLTKTGKVKSNSLHRIYTNF